MRGVFVDANEALAVIMERLEQPGDPKVRIHRDPDIKPEQYPEILDGAEIAIVDHTALPTEVAKKCAGLKHVVFLGTGARSYMNPEELAELGISVHLIKGYGDTAVAESAIALMWASARVIAVMDREMRGGNWLREDGMQLTGKTLGLIGFGGIAAEVARIASGSGMKVIAWNRSPKSHPGVEFTDLDKLLARADVVSLHLLLNRRDPRHDHPREDREDEAGRHPHQHRPRRRHRRDRHDRRAGVGPHPPCRPRCFQYRTPARRSSADEDSECDAVGAFGLPHAGSK
ncbi:phosphoglycerate dehydrogenase-like enzyme [Bradyrhizobium sp. LM2.9]